MELMQRRRELMVATSGKRDYLSNVAWIDGYLLNDYGVITAHPSCKYTETYIQVIPGNSYALSGHAYSTAAYDRIHGYNANEEWMSRLYRLDWPKGEFSSTIVIPDGCYYIRISTENTTETHMYDA